MSTQCSAQQPCHRSSRAAGSQDYHLPPEQAQTTYTHRCVQRALKTALMVEHFCISHVRYYFQKASIHLQPHSPYTHSRNSVSRDPSEHVTGAATAAIHRKHQTAGSWREHPAMASVGSSKAHRPGQKRSVRSGPPATSPTPHRAAPHKATLARNQSAEPKLTIEPQKRHREAASKGASRLP